MPELSDLAPQLTKLLDELDKQTSKAKCNGLYRDGKAPIPPAIETARLKTAYNALMGMSQAPWAAHITNSKLDRLEIGGIKTGDENVDKALWSEVWQRNGLDSASKLADDGALTNGRVFATVWPDDDGQPEVVFDGADQMVVQYQEGRHQQRHRVAALRRWEDSDTGKLNITLYRREALYKFVECKEQAAGNGRVRAGDKWWEPRYDDADDKGGPIWPLPNPYKVVPVVEIATNQRLQSGPFLFARGEFEHCHGVLDRISLLTFLGLVVAVWMGFPLRFVIGDKILRDDDNNPIAPLSAKPDEVSQFEDPAAKVGQLEPADRKNLSIYAELAQLAYLCSTPAHYFPSDTGYSNIAEPTIRAFEGGMHAAIRGIHKPQLGEGYEEVLRVAGLMLPDRIIVPATAEVLWLDHESRSMAERADAAVKVAAMGQGPEWMAFVAERFLGLNQEEVGRLLANQAFADLVQAVKEPAVVEPEPEPVAA